MLYQLSQGHIIKAIMTLHRPIITFLVLSTTLWFGQAAAQENCATATNRSCIAAEILKSADEIKEPQWKDVTLRDLAASLTYDKRVDDAIALVPKISNPDTQAMTIRTIGMTAALYGKDSPVVLKETFVKLAAAAATIKQPAANAIAYTYIAMAQAFAGMDADAWATADAMTNPALKHKAFGETAEIQAERGDLSAAMQSIGKIDAASFRNKAYQNIAEILIKKGMYDEALKSATAIDNPMKRAQTLQEILKGQEEKTRGARNDQADKE